MTTRKRVPHLAAGILTLCLTWPIGPTVSEAKGPQAADLTISVFTPAWDWPNPYYPVGTFSSTGLINDTGDVYYLGSLYDVDGLQILRNRCLFVGLHGSFETVLPASPENHGEYAFELFGGTDAYIDLNAAGTAKAATKQSFWWECFDSPWGCKKEKVYYLDVSWKMEGFLIP